MAHNQCIVTGPVGPAGTTYTDVHYAAGNALEATVTGSLVYGSGGTSIRVRLEGSPDVGQSWFPVGDMVFAKADAVKSFVIQTEPFVVFDPTDPLNDDDTRNVLPQRLRVSVEITGAYDDSTLSVWVAIKDMRLTPADIDGGTYV